MKLLVDLHVSPRTAEFLRRLGHDVVRVGETLSASSSDREIVEAARAESRILVTQDLDFSAILALSEAKPPALISIRLSSSRVEVVDAALARVLPALSNEPATGGILVVEDGRARKRRLPIV